MTAGFCLIVGLVSSAISDLQTPCIRASTLMPRQENETGRCTKIGKLSHAHPGAGLHRASDLPELILRSGQITGLLAPLIAVSVVMQQILSLIGRARTFITEFMHGALGGYYAVLGVCMLPGALAAGTILESLPNTIILAPILAPIAASLGVDPIHLRSFPGRRRHRLHHPALWPESICRKRNYRHPLFSITKIYYAIPVCADGHMADHRPGAAAVDDPPLP